MSRIRTRTRTRTGAETMPNNQASQPYPSPTYAIQPFVRSIPIPALPREMLACLSAFQARPAEENYTVMTT